MNNENNYEEDVLEFKKHLRKHRIKSLFFVSLAFIGVVTLFLALFGGASHFINVIVKSAFGV